MLNAIAAILSSLALFVPAISGFHGEHRTAAPKTAPACQLIGVTIAGDLQFQTQPSWHSVLLVNTSALPSNTQFHSSYETMAVGLNAGASWQVPFRTGGIVTVTGNRAGTEIYACHNKA